MLNILGAAVCAIAFSLTGIIFGDPFTPFENFVLFLLAAIVFKGTP
jgi:predicted Na+-dependent transporter